MHFADRVAQVVEHLPSKLGTLSSEHPRKKVVVDYPRNQSIIMEYLKTSDDFACILFFGPHMCGRHCIHITCNQDSSEQINNHLENQLENN
jgi:hypothetical protein